MPFAADALNRLYRYAYALCGDQAAAFDRPAARFPSAPPASSVTPGATAYAGAQPA